MVNIGNSWDTRLKDEFSSDYYKKLREFLKYEYSHYTVYPNMNDIFNSIKAVDFDDVAVVILGQDPYHEPGQAHGFAFSVKPGIPQPPSLFNIFSELQSDMGCMIPNNGCLEYWAKQGVLLLNTSLTVRKGEAASHSGKGWEKLTDKIIELLNERQKPIVFMLWGSHARSKKPLITNPNHLILEAVHPSPLSAYRGFFGCKHFSTANKFLKQNKMKEIDWQIPNIF